MSKTETQIRSDLIDQQLALAGWNIKDPTQVVEEFDIVTALQEGIFGPAAANEQIETWKDVYGIEERYKSKLCTESDGKAWLVEVLDEWRWHDETAGKEGKVPDAYLRDVSRHAKRSSFANTNFLKKPFLLDACHMLGLFEPVPAQPTRQEA